MGRAICVVEQLNDACTGFRGFPLTKLKVVHRSETGFGITVVQLVPVPFEDQSEGVPRETAGGPIKRAVLRVGYHSDTPC